MKWIACIAVVGAPLIASSLPVAAADEAPTYFVMSVGVDSCGAWTQGRKDRDTPQTWREFWVLGYLTGVNRWGLPSDRGAVRKISQGTDPPGLYAWIDNYCTAKPLETLNAATEALAFELAPKWLAAHPARK